MPERGQRGCEARGWRRFDERGFELGESHDDSISGKHAARTDAIDLDPAGHFVRGRILLAY
jgi:hypothetical protein